MTVAIKIENLSKQYRLGLVSTRTLSHDLNRWWQTTVLGKEDPYLKIGEVNDRATRGDGDYVWALRDINLEVEQGEVLGIIGKNGAGKSTLLKILSKVTAPTTGTIKTKGRIASLLEVGTGFHYEMTGRENIFMNGAIMGMSKAEITRKLDEIIDFAGVERYIDTPVKRYSSGMIVRLGFAVAAHLEPEILVVDEVLAVGDAEFQKKAIGKMQDISHGQGRTVLFVSHNMGAVMNLCRKGIILNIGEVHFVGNVDIAVTKYLNQEKDDQIYSTTKESDIYLKKIFTINEDKDLIASYGINESPRLLIVIACKLDKNLIWNIILGIVLLDESKNKIFTVEFDLNETITNLSSSEIQIIAKFPKRLLAPGTYSFMMAIHQPNVKLFDEVYDVCRFIVVEDETIGHFKYPKIRQGVIVIEPNFKVL